MAGRKPSGAVQRRQAQRAKNKKKKPVEYRGGTVARRPGVSMDWQDYTRVADRYTGGMPTAHPWHIESKDRLRREAKRARESARFRRDKRRRAAARYK